MSREQERRDMADLIGIIEQAEKQAKKVGLPSIENKMRIDRQLLERKLEHDYGLTKVEEEPEAILVPIDRSSIRKNPHAGQTEVRYPGAVHTSILVTFAATPEKARPKSELVGAFAEGAGGMAVRMTVQDGLVEVQLEMPSDIDLKAFCERLKKMIDTDRDTAYRDISIHQQRNVHTAHFLQPQPPYLYRYLETEVTCDSCGSRFPHTELESDELDLDTWSDTICPRCGEWGCCEIEFEKFTDEMAAVATEE